jgi:hypothetical protein
MKIVLEDTDIQKMIRSQITQTNLLGLGDSEFGIDIIYDESTDEVTATIDTNVSIPDATPAPEAKVKRKRRTPAQMAADGVITEAAKVVGVETAEKESEAAAKEPDTTGDAPFVPDSAVNEEKEEEHTPSKSLFA